jgi:simple sugar transport system substrate-binding protein
MESGNYSAVVTLAPYMGLAAVDAARAAQVDVVITTFDFDPVVADAIRSGDLAFTVDQRLYLQGSLPVELLTDYLGGGTPPSPDGPVETGPFFIDDTNVDASMAEMNDIIERLDARFGS